MAYRTIRRRDLLKITVVSALAPAVPLMGCGSDSKPGPEPEEEPSESPKDQARVFPQGLMSGDPRPDSIVLWTRVEPTAKKGGKETATITVGWELSTDDAFKHLVNSGELDVAPDTDHTLRLKVKDLDPAKTYYYRFTAFNVRSMVGRTKTAPKDDADVPVRFAFAACQDFVGRFYHSWKALLAEDPVDFVVFLGDYVYETDGNPSFQTPGEGRSIVLPDGVSINDSSKAAKTLADYRSLYKQFRTDANLQEVQRLFPFVCIWDDHEFGDDCWQDHTTHFNGTMGDEKVTQQRQDADQAWFEYQPADIPWDGSKAYPDDIKIYRTLRYGKHAELFLTDQRFYRDRALIPEGPADLSVAKLSPNSKVGSHIFLLKSGFDPQEAMAKPTMLGAEQKSWFIDAVKGSTATWKLWGNEVQLAQMVVNLKPFTMVPPPFNDQFYLTVDQWDGFRTERQEILTALSGVSNLVAITGDIHAFYAAELHPDFDMPGPKPVAVEYVTAGISSQAVASSADGVLSQPTYANLGLHDLVPMWDTLLLQDSPHYRYGNSFVNGVSVCDLSAEKIDVTFLIVKDVQKPDFDPSTVERARFRTMAGSNTVETL